MGVSGIILYLEPNYEELKLLSTALSKTAQRKI